MRKNGVCVRFEVLTAVLLKPSGMLHCASGSALNFLTLKMKAVWSFQLSGTSDEGGMILPTISYFSPNNTVWHQTRILNLQQKSARERERERGGESNVEIYLTINSIIHTVCLNVNAVKSRIVRLAGEYKKVLSRLVHKYCMSTAQICTRMLAVLTGVCFAQSLQTNAKIVFQFGHYHFLENCKIVGSHSSIAEHWSLLELCCVVGQVVPRVWKAPWSFEMGRSTVPVAQCNVTTDNWSSETLQQEPQILQKCWPLQCATTQQEWQRITASRRSSVMKIQVFWNVMPCWLVNNYPYF